jgi:hypothetical protein
MGRWPNQLLTASLCMPDPRLPAVPPRIALTTPTFPPKYADPTLVNAKLQTALDRAMATATQTFPSLSNVGLAVVELGSPPNAMAHHKGDIGYFGASMIKIAALYALYELRTTLRAVAKELGTKTSKRELLVVAARHLNAQIMKDLPKLHALSGVARAQALPQ